MRYSRANDCCLNSFNNLFSLRGKNKVEEYIVNKWKEEQKAKIITVFEGSRGGVVVGFSTRKPEGSGFGSDPIATM